MTTEPDTTGDLPSHVDVLIRAVPERLAAVDDELADSRHERKMLNARIKELLAEKAQLERIVRASRPRKTRATS